MENIEVSIEKILMINNPLDTPPWRNTVDLDSGEFKRMVLDFIDNSFLIDDRVCEPVDNREATAEAHAMRIAWLSLNGWDDVISLDVGVPSLGFMPEWIIDDGNHRLYAAMLRGDTHIQCQISGEIEYAHDILGLKKEKTRSME